MRRSTSQSPASKGRPARLQSEHRAIRRVVGSAVSDDGTSATIELECAAQKISLQFSDADLPSLFAAAASAYERCRRSSKNPEEKHALPAEGILVEHSNDDKYTVITVTLVGGQRLSFLLPRQVA